MLSVVLGLLSLALTAGLLWTLYQNQKLKASNLAFERDNHLFNTLLQITTDSIYFKDIHSRFIRCSRVLLRLFNLSDAAEIVGKSDLDFFTSEHAEQALKDEKEIIDTGVAIIGKEEKETWPDGSETWV